MPQTTTHTSFLISGVRGQVLSTVQTPGGHSSISPPAHSGGTAAPKVPPPQPKGDQKYLAHPLLTTQVHVHKPACL